MKNKQIETNSFHFTRREYKIIFFRKINVLCQRGTKNRVRSYFKEPSSCTQWAAVTSHFGLMRDAPQT